MQSKTSAPTYRDFNSLPRPWPHHRDLRTNPAHVFRICDVGGSFPSWYSWGDSICLGKLEGRGEPEPDDQLTTARRANSLRKGNPTRKRSRIKRQLTDSGSKGSRRCRAPAVTRSGMPIGYKLSCALQLCTYLGLCLV